MSINKEIDNVNETNPNNQKNAYQVNLTVGNNNDIKGNNKKGNLDFNNKNDGNKRNANVDKMDINLSEINTKIKGYLDSQTNINIIHFSCYDDSENIINTTDLNLSKKLYEEIYNFIFVTYAKIQSNINKLKKNFTNIVQEELYRNSIKLENADFMTGVNSKGLRDKNDAEDNKKGKKKN